MNCREVREYLFAFLDSELDAALSIDVQLHLERCADCAREVEIEREVRRSLEQVLINAIQPVAAHIPRVAPRRLRRLAVAIAALLILALFAWFALRPSGPPAAPSFAQWAVADFVHFVEKGGQVELASGDPDAVGLWLTRRTSLHVDLPAAPDGRSTLLGGRKCKRGGLPVAFAAYSLDGMPASLVALPADDTDLSGMRPVDNAGRHHWVDHCMGHTVVACRRGELVYAAVSTLPEEMLLLLMPHDPPAHEDAR